MNAPDQEWRGSDPLNGSPVNLRYSRSFPRFVRWMKGQSDKQGREGWVSATRAELAELLAPGGKGHETTRVSELRRWARAGFVADSGLLDNDGHDPTKPVRLGLTARGTRAARALGIDWREITVAVDTAAVPRSDRAERISPDRLAMMRAAEARRGVSPEDTVVGSIDVAQHFPYRAEPEAPSVGGVLRQLKELRGVIDAAAAILERVGTRRFAEDLGAEELFSLAVERAREEAKRG